MNQSQAMQAPTAVIAEVPTAPTREMSTLIFQKPLSWQDAMMIEVLLDRYRDDEGAFAKIEADDRVTLLIPSVIRRVWER